jgi:hypothetical protein
MTLWFAQLDTGRLHSCHDGERAFAVRAEHSARVRSDYLTCRYLPVSPAGLLSEITASIEQSGSSPQGAILPRIESETRFHVVSLVVPILFLVTS